MKNPCSRDVSLTPLRERTRARKKLRLARSMPKLGVADWTCLTLRYCSHDVGPCRQVLTTATYLLHDQSSRILEGTKQAKTAGSRGRQCLQFGPNQQIVDICQTPFLLTGILQHVTCFGIMGQYQCPRWVCDQALALEDF